MYHFTSRFARSAFNSRARLRCILLLVALAAVPFPAVCQDRNWTPSEKKAVSELADGGDANFSNQKSAVSDDFVEKLLSGGFKSSDPAHNMEVHGITISNAVFQEPITVNFDVPYRVTFDHCEFQKGIDFSGSQFSKDLVFNSSIFGPSTAPAGADSANGSDVALQFIGATVNGALSFKNSVFQIPVDFTKAHVKELHLDDDTFASADQDDPDLDLTAARVESDFSVSAKTAQPHEVVAQFFSVGGSASLGKDSAPFFGTKNFDLTYTRFQNLDIHGFDQWRSNNSQSCAISLDGFMFQEIYIPGSASSAWKMLELFDSPQFCYSTQPYLMLEQNLSASGNTGLASDAYIRMRNRQREQRVLNPRSFLGAWSAWLGDWVLDLLIGYGREPWRAGLFAIGFTLLGMLIFDRSHMMAQNSEEKNKADAKGDNKSPGTSEDKTETRAPEKKKNDKQNYSRFWYSLDVLAPAIELGADKAWQPNPDWWFGRNYAYIHRIAGWILIPLILAAITGIVH